MLHSVEKKILSHLNTVYRAWYVDIGSVVGQCDKIWTLSLNPESINTPLVLLHGLGAGVASWCLNLDAFAAHRPVYAIDLLGFGRSSRPALSGDSMEAEQQMVTAIEEWRRHMKLDNFVLLGHSMGGFLATSYAISYPNRVKHLILADPWGFPEKVSKSQKNQIPLWARIVAFVAKPFNPLWYVRVTGPLGQWMIWKTRPDLAQNFSCLLKDEALIYQYAYHCNAQIPPSGECAFHAMMAGFILAKNPMIKRLEKLREDISLTFLYGSRSWVPNSAEDIKNKRPYSYIKSEFIADAGHQLYAEKPEVFNNCVLEACAQADFQPDEYFYITVPLQEKLETKVFDFNFQNHLQMYTNILNSVN